MRWHRESAGGLRGAGRSACSSCPAKQWAPGHAAAPACIFGHASGAAQRQQPACPVACPGLAATNPSQRPSSWPEQGICIGQEALRTALPRLQAAQQQRGHAVHQQGLQPLLQLRLERVCGDVVQRGVRQQCAVYAAQSRCKGVRVACGVARRLGFNHTRAPLPVRGRRCVATSSSAPQCAPQLASSPCSRTPTRSLPPAVLHKAFRYVACAPSPTSRSLSYSIAAQRRSCTRPGSDSPDAQCDNCWQ